MSAPDLPARAALFLDLDGTLLDLAPTPAQVVVPDGLVATLRRLRTALDGALAVVTGRPIEQIDALLDDAPFAVAGEHGGAIRFAPGAAEARAPLPAVPAHWLDLAQAAAARAPGALVEPKPRGLVLHYRLAPEAGAALGALAHGLVAEDQHFTVLAAHMAWEVKPRGADKGTAVAALMARAPFAGRVPVYVGDDVTDEDGIRAAVAAGGLGLRVAETFVTPAGVRSWLEQQQVRSNRSALPSS